MNPITTFKNNLFVALGLSVALFSLTQHSTAQSLAYFQNFDSDDTGNWTVNTVGGYNPADIYFDYSTVGIPPAPNSTNSTTRAIKLQANLDPATPVVPSGVSVSPNGFGVSGNFEMRFDWWINFNGPAPAGGNGSTQIGGAGFGTAGTGAQVGGSTTSGGVADSIFFGATGDGGTTDDWRIYSPAFVAGAGLPASVFVAGDRNVTGVAYYTTNFPGQSPPLAQATLYPNQTGIAQDGAMAFKWHDVSLKKVANIVTYTVDGVLIATIDMSTNGTLGGTNILFNHYDINSTVSSDPDSTNTAFSLFDNVRVTNLPTVVTVSSAVPNASEQGPSAGVFTLTRSGAGSPLTVFYSFTGTAISNTDYTINFPSSVTFAAADLTTNVTITPVDDVTVEVTETVILTVNNGSNYIATGSATVTIADNESSQLTLTNLSTQMYERTNDYASFQISRAGNTNAAAFTVNLSYAGTAGSNVDYYTETVTLSPGDETKTFRIYPIEDSAIEVGETVVCSLAAAGGGEYAIGSTSTSGVVTIVNSTPGSEITFFSDNFDTDTSTNWTIRYASQNGFDDYTATFNYDYGADSIPAAPHSSGDRHGLKVTVNKLEASALGGAGINLYPNGRNFTNDFALRFDMYLINGQGGSATEYAMFGINHSGTKTNWFRSGGVPAGWTFDGLFFDIESDNGASATDYAIYSAPTTTNNTPTTLASRTTSGLTGIFKAPPFSVAGLPSNTSTNPTPTWADVEVKQINGVVTLSVNTTPILSYTNTGAFTNGNIMIGYDDAFDSIGPATAAVIYDNVRVVSQTPLRVTGTRIVSGNVQIDFTDSTFGPWTVKSGASLTGTSGANLTNTIAATFTTNSFGNFRATVPYNLSEFSRLYRIQR